MGKTKEALIEAGRAAFAAKGYEGANVREIGEAAGANPSLIIRYFGSKAGFFEACFTGRIDLGPGLKTVNRSLFPNMLADWLCGKPEAAHLRQSLSAMGKSSGAEEVSGIVRRLLQDEFETPLAMWLGGKARQEPAASILALALGACLARNELGTEGASTLRFERVLASALKQMAAQF